MLFIYISLKLCCNMRKQFFFNLNIRNEMNERVLGHLCAHIGSTGPGEPTDDVKCKKIARKQINPRIVKETHN